jgi:hypothetical protein
MIELVINLSCSIFVRSQCFPLRVTGWPLELMAYAYLAVSPSSMRGKFEEVLCHLLSL